MSHTRLWVAASIIALVVIGGFVLSVPHTRDVPKTPALQSADTGVPSVSVRDLFKKGVHTITGSLLAPNACATVSAQASLQGDASSTTGILIDLMMPNDSGVCLQVPTRVTFEASVSAPASLPITVMVNGALATTSAP